ncbi:ribosome small subunit-dependent GTPase A [Limnohabitans sp.]|uniref:ribosome small subunit-dependent GTPase A n=1 Tax=Limnohabitans sp. TaxID=1907725 RepID=UPI00286EFD4E|nr:ribosome small subunit-dependent GTPase A [Limnohabitans sp.]
MKQSGLVVASHGRHCVVETPDGERRICHPRGKKSQVVVGDRVQWLASTDEGTIEKVEPRHNLFYRQDEIRTKSFAANLDQVLILLAAEPEFSEMQLTRALIAAEAEHITPIIVLNKRDLTELHARAFTRLAPYVTMGYTVLQGAFKSGDLGDLPERLKHKTTLVLGPSGTGKSTLINALVPHANVATAEISQALNSGKHTTTSTTWHWVDAERKTGLIDSPGFQEFGVHHIDAMQLAAYMPDFKPHVANCKFYNCTHLHEPSCGVQDAVATGAISPSRYKLYGMLFAQLTQPVNY